jgi:hypothetical protein
MAVIMGIRIHKNIGYFLSLDKVDDIFVNNYSEILENFDYSEDNQEQLFFNNLEQQIQGLNNSRQAIFKFELQEIINLFNNNKLSVLDLISTVYFGDDLVGIIFRTPDMIKASRYDDLIDYYDNREQLDQIKLLHSPIYPVMGFTYLGGLEDYNINHTLKIGEIYSENLGTLAYKLNNLVYNKSFNTQLINSTSTILTTNDYFHPKIDELIYVLATTSGLLKKDISNSYFDKLLEHAIIETWG